jgi:Neuraminidase (sialidase)
MLKLVISLNALFFSIWAFFNVKNVENPTPMADKMPMCSGNMSESGIQTWSQTAFFAPAKSVASMPSAFPSDTSKAYAMPLLWQTSKGDIMLSWTEKDEKGVTSFCLAVSKDKGKTFSEKQVIYAGTGVGNSRLMRAKVLQKKDGSLVAVFSNRMDAPPPSADKQGDKKGGRGGRSLDIVYCESKDNGATWTSPKSVDADPTKGIVKGFFDAIVLPNDEIAVVYLKDVANSQKHEERDLRLVLSKNGVFQPEKVIDPVVCDCCNINFLVDAKGALNVYYRDNNDDIRDIAKMTSTDNGATFSKPEIVHNDGWKINGCPHSGAVSSSYNKSTLVAWYSGAETESGIRLVTGKGKKLFVVNDPSAKNPSLMADAQTAVMMWELAPMDKQTGLAFRKIVGENVTETMSIEGAQNAVNSIGLVVDNQLLIAHEVKQENKRNSLRIATVKL